MKIGFTGTQEGMTGDQWRAIGKYFIEIQPSVTELHHGMCEGADTNFDNLARGCRGDFTYKIIGHPGVTKDGRVWKRGDCYPDIILPEKFFLERNRDTVDVTDELWATPSGPEVLRSGTWSTIRYAITKARKPVRIFWPDGTSEVR